MSKTFVRTDKGDGSTTRTDHGPAIAATVMRIAEGLGVTADEIFAALNRGEKVQNDFAWYEYEKTDQATGQQ